MHKLIEKWLKKSNKKKKKDLHLVYSNPVSCLDISEVKTNPCTTFNEWMNARREDFQSFQRLLKWNCLWIVNGHIFLLLSLRFWNGFSVGVCSIHRDGQIGMYYWVSWILNQCITITAHWHLAFGMQSIWGPTTNYYDENRRKRNDATETQTEASAAIALNE